MLDRCDALLTAWRASDQLPAPQLRSIGMTKLVRMEIWHFCPIADSLDRAINAVVGELFSLMGMMMR
jgi:hypothetical protein